MRGESCHMGQVVSKRNCRTGLLRRVVGLSHTPELRVRVDVPRHLLVAAGARLDHEEAAVRPPLLRDAARLLEALVRLPAARGPRACVWG